MKSLLRHYGIRKLVFVLAAWPCCLCLRWLLAGNPPAGWYSWPETARSAIGLLSSGSYLLAAFAWLVLLLSPLRSIKDIRLKPIALIALAMGTGWWAVPGSLMMAGGLVQWARAGLASSTPIMGLLLWIAIVPISISMLVAFWPDVMERLHALPTYRRLLVSGRGHAAGWLGPVGMRKLMHSLPQRVPVEGGHRSPLLHLGQSLFETTYRGGQDVWLNENSHLITCARPGSGKFVASIAPNLAMYQGSGLFVSNKAELADFAVGRRADQSLFEVGNDRSVENLGVDTREITQVRYTLPGGRCFVLDPTQQSVWPTSCHNFLSEIDIREPNAPALISAIAAASFPDNPHQKDPFWINCPRGLFAASIGHVLTTERNPAGRSLIACADFCLGIDPVTGNADPDVFKKNVITMMQNNQLGGFIQKSASAVGTLGRQTLGGVFAELERHTRWLSDQRVRQQVHGRSDFSYRELGNEASPVSVFPVLPRGGVDLQSLLPWARTHIELSLAIFETKRDRPQTEILTLFDEFRQYGDKINAIRLGATTLREAGVKLWVVVQSWASLIDTLGQAGANELEACSALEFFGTDQFTAEKIARMLGQHTVKHGRRSKAVEKVLDVITPAEVMHELRKGSPLKYVFPATLPATRLRRTAYQPLVTEEMVRYPGLPLSGHYDANLSRYRYARRAA